MPDTQMPEIDSQDVAQGETGREVVPAKAEPSPPPAPARRRAALPAPSAPPPGFALDYLPDGAAIEHAPLPWLARSTLYVLAGLLVALVLWAGFAQVDRIVTAGGRLVTTAPLVVAQPLETAVVRGVDVQVGDRVRAGDRLATLDPTFAAADLADLTAKLASVEAQIGRLRAELDGGDFTPADTPDAAVQAAILERRRAEYRSRLASLDEKAGQLDSAIAASRRAQAGLAERLAVVGEVEDIRRQLQERQTGSRLTWLEARVERLRMRDDLTALQDREQASAHELRGVQADRAAFIDEWRRKTAEDLVEQTRQRATLVEQIAKAERRRSLVTLTAPVDAVVLEVAKRSVGSVIREAEPLVTLVPADVPLEVEAEIPSRDIGLVRVGDFVRVKLDAFPFQRHGTLPGEIRTISADAFTHDPAQAAAAPINPDGPRPAAGAVFRARIRLTDTRLEAVPAGTLLSPGMVASAEIRVGTRSVLSYFLYPVIRALDESIREP
ncbi:HlyD family secretion protein [Azospirillum lipoferum]|uniref:Membrane fusion protein (MFP) family protein n=1 Tax=Azospirillum lipoferum TaxID=193 RepID=A0A5A9GJB5_AZOLI|nr:MULTISPECIES: HlyD family type I secretion periplasmic adaptor subunit [Azospirillum]KAA0593804.1 HlyD family type I secretion periplasmic adaptor subunit [Azospirillum lipoferum]MCP1614137.1 HlyD family secretion protein [Azospirillum lipoferum]MDW5536823.1 HlyD family type I secretion periplasmic adaptor subunit [Azospirillum sp. NL1]